MKKILQIAVLKPTRNKRLKELREAVIMQHARVVENGGKLCAYECNHCHFTCPTVQPTKALVSSKGYWDSATTCINCNGLNFVKVWPSGRTESIIM